MSVLVALELFCPLVSCCVNGFLLNQYRLANRTMLDFGKSGFGAGGSLCGVDYLGVTLCGDDLGCAGNLCVTYHAVNNLVVRTVNRAGSRYFVLPYGGAVGVTLLFNYCLRLGDFGCAVCVAEKLAALAANPVLSILVCSALTSAEIFSSISPTFLVY